jgi:hypothetical protein
LPVLSHEAVRLRAVGDRQIRDSWHYSSQDQRMLNLCYCAGTNLNLLMFSRNACAQFLAIRPLHD